MYPLAVILIVAWTGNEKKALRNIPYFAIPGWLIAGYHAYSYHMANFGESTAGLLPCSTQANVGCSAQYIEWFNGYVSIPL